MTLDEALAVMDEALLARAAEEAAAYRHRLESAARTPEERDAAADAVRDYLVEVAAYISCCQERLREQWPALLEASRAHGGRRPHAEVIGGPRAVPPINGAGTVH